MAFELEIIHFLQSLRNAFLDLYFEFFTYFGEEVIIIAILGFIYWGYNKQYGEQIGITVFLSLVLNSTIKLIVHRLRPFQVDDQITNLRPETSGGYSFPSGHTQGSATVFGGLIFWMKKRWLTMISVFIILMVAISRMYIGVHYLTDVLVGGFLGLIIAYLMHKYFSTHSDSTKLYKGLTQLTIVLFILIYIYRLFTANATSLLTNAGDLYSSMADLSKMSGAMIGFILGVQFEHQHVNFNQHRVLWKNIVRTLIGLLVIMLIRVSLKAVFGVFVDNSSLQEGELFSASIAILFDMIRYFAMVFVGIGVYPLLFRKVKI